MSEKDIEKYYKIYEAAQASRINQSLTNGVINAYTQICGLIIKSDDKGHKQAQLDKLNSDLKNDYLVRDQLEQWTSYLTFKMGPIMPLLSATMITFENLNRLNEDRTRNETRSETRNETRETSASNKETKDSKAD